MEDEHVSISRRGFIGMAASVIAAGTVNLVAGPMTFAYADENSEKEFDIEVVGKEEYGVVVSDFETGALLEGVKVTIHSWYSDTSIEAKTIKKSEKKAFAIFNIKDIAEPTKDNGGRLKFWGSLKLELDGYRIFETGMIRMTGASHAEVGSKKLDGNPYLRLFTFNDFDIQYPKNPETFALANTNTEKHTLALRVAASEGSSVTVSYYCNGYWDKSSKQVSSGYADISFVYDYLNDNNVSWKFLPGEEIYAIVEADGKRFKVTARMNVERIRGVDNKSSGSIGLSPGFMTSYIRPDDSDEITQEALIAEGDNGLLGIGFTLPEKIPGVGGSKIEIKTPDLPVLYDFDPTGLAMIGIGVSSKRVTKKGQTDPSRWKYESWKSLKDQFEESGEDWSNAWDAYLSNTRHPDPNNPDVNRWNKASRWNVLWKLTMELSVAAMLTARWKLKESEWSGELKSTFSFGIKYEHSQQLALGPVPACIIFEFGANATVSGALNVTFTGLFRNASWTPGKAGFGFEARISLYVTFSAGIKGVATIGIRGGGYLAFGVGFYIPPKDSLPLPHLTLGAGAGFDFVVQIFLIKWSGRIYGDDWPALIDNWKNSTSSDWDENNPEWYGDYSDPDVSALPINEELAFNMEDGQLGYTLGSADAFQQDGDAFAAIMSSTMLDVSATTDDASQYQLVKSTELAKTCEMKGSSKGTAMQAVKEAIDRGEAWDPASLEAYDEETTPYQYDPEEESFSWVYDASSIEGDGCLDVAYGEDQIGVGGVSMRGVKPSNETLLINDVFSDTRTRLVGDRDGNLYLFRILIVEYPPKDTGFDTTVYRSRLTVAKYNNDKFEKPQVIEFGLYKNEKGISRRDLYDYDFDVKALPKEFTCTFVVAMTCGTRPKADESTLHDVENNMGFITIHLSSNNQGITVWRHNDYMKISKEFATRDHLLLLPRVVVLEGRSGVCEKSVVCSLVHSYFSQYGGRRWAINYVSYHCNSEEYWGFGELFPEGDSYAALWPCIPISVEALDLSTCPVCGMHGMLLPFGIAITLASTKEVIDEKGTKRVVPVQRSAFLGFNAGYCHFYWPGSAPLEDNQIGIPVAWPKHNAVVLNVYGTLTAVRPDSWTQGYAITEIIGLEKLNIQQFCFSEDGNTIYFTRANDGPFADMIAPDGTRTKVDNPNYTIMACRCYLDADNKERFRSPYQFGEVSRAVDSMYETQFHGHSAFLYTHNTKMAESKADIYLAAIPHVKSATLIKMASASVLVDAGSTAKMLIFVRNDGNICLQAMKVDVYTVDDSGTRTLYKTISIDCSMDSSVYNSGDLDIQDTELESEMTAMSEEDSPASNAAKAGAFIPGAQRCFIASMDIDKEWRGTIKLVGVLRGENLEPCRIPGYAEPESIIGSEDMPESAVVMSYTQPEAEWPMTDFALNDVEMVDLGDYDTADNPYTFDPGTDDPSTDKKVLPTTGDSSLTDLGVAGAALTLGAAGMLAYSKRRTQNEDPLSEGEDG